MADSVTAGTSGNGIDASKLQTREISALPPANDYELVWNNTIRQWVPMPESGGPGSSTWGSITGTLSDQTDLQSVLDAKQPLDGDLTSWATITRASGFDTFTAIPSGTNLASLLTSAIPISKGGTGAASLTNHGVVVAGASSLSTVAPGTSGNALISDGADWTSSVLSGSGIALSQLGSSTYSTTQHLMNFALSPGVSSGGAITVSGTANAVDVAAGTGFIKATDSNVATLSFFDWSAASAVSVPSNTTRYIGVQYNAGSPNVVAKTSDTWDLDTEFPLGVVVNESGTRFIVNNPWITADNQANLIERFDSLASVARDNRLGGLILGTTGTRNVTVSTGSLLDRMTEFSVSAIDTSGAGTFDAYYRDGSGGWTKQSAQAQYDVTKYDDNSGTLATMTVLDYSSRWFYLMTDGTLAMLYGQNQTTSVALGLGDSAPTSTPSRIARMGILIGRLVIQQGTNAPTSTQTVFTTSFSSNSVQNHSDLANIQGGTAGERYHLTSAEYTGSGTGNFARVTSPVFVTPVLGIPSSGNLANCTFPTLNQNTTGNAASLSISGQTGLVTLTGLTSTNRIKTVRDAADTILELGGSYTPTGTWTSLPLTSPKITTGINDANGNSMLAFTATASAVYGFTLTDAAVGGTVVLGVTTPTQGASGIVGTPLSLAASDAVAGSSNAGAVAGGSVTITSGAAKRLTSGNGDGGRISLNVGAGIGGASGGNVEIGGTITNGQNGALVFTNAGSNPSILAPGTGRIRFAIANAGTGKDIAVNGGFLEVASDQFKVGSGAYIGWSSTSYTEGAVDAAFERVGAASIRAINGTTNQLASLSLGVRDSGTTTVTNGLTIGHQSTGTPAAGLGSGILFNVDTTTTADQNAGQISALWTNAAHATRTADVVVSAVKSGAALAEVARFKANGVTQAAALKSNAVTFADAITSPVEGTVQSFTDSSTNTIGATITGSGSNHVLGYYNGTNWIAATGATPAGTGDMLKADNLSGLSSNTTARTNLGSGGALSVDLMPVVNLAPVVDYVLAALYSLVVGDSFAIASGHTITIAAGAVLMIL